MIKVKIGKKKELNEIAGAVATIGAFLVGILSAIASLAGIGLLIKKFGGMIDSADKKITDALKSLSAEDQQEYAAAMQELRVEAENIQQETSVNPTGETGGSGSEKRPSVRIAEKIGSVARVVNAIKAKPDNIKLLRSNPEIETALNGGMREMTAAYETCANLDLMASIASKKDPKGLWNTVIKDSIAGEGTPAGTSTTPSTPGAFKNNSKWLEFVQVVASQVATKPRVARPAELLPSSTE